MSRARGIALVGVPLAFLVYFFLYPLVTVLLTGLVSDGKVDLAVSDNSQLGGKGTFRVYRNLGATFTTTPWWESKEPPGPERI